MWRDAVLVAGKDLRVERRSKVAMNQVAPLAVLVLVVFAFALDPDRGILERAAPGLFWVAVLLCTVLAVQRSAAIEAGDDARDGLRMSGLDPAGIFLGKAAAVGAELLALEALLAAGVVVLYGRDLGAPVVLVATALLAAGGLAAAGTVYAALAAGVRVRETLLPMLLVPVAAPVVLAATRAWEAGLAGASAEAWPWTRLLALFTVAYAVAGVLAYGALLEDA